MTRLFGPQHFDLVEDSVQEALLKAMRNWSYRGVPENPRAWIMTVARNRVLDELRRNRSLWDKRGAVVEYDLNHNGNGLGRLDLIESDLRDDQLRMIFMCCHPAISREAQVALTLKTVGGFGVSEIARAFLSSETTVAQRLVRAKRSIRECGIPCETPDRSQISGRLDSVLEVLYLLFSEGYSAHQGEDLIRHDLCAEAIRLCSLAARHPLCDLPKAHALLALLLLQASRLPARLDPLGDIILLENQDRALWDRKMIRLGMQELDLSSRGDELSKYHLEAGIASLHAMAPSYEETDWEEILSIYNSLLAMTFSPVIALNRAIALAMVEGWRAGIRELEALDKAQAISGYHHYYAALAEMHRRAGDESEASQFYQQAIELAQTEAEKRFLMRRRNGEMLL